MSQNTLEIRPASLYAVLVTLTYGSQIRRYARWDSDLVVGGETFVSEPTIEVELGEQHGGTDDKTSKLTLTANREPFPRMMTGHKHVSVKVRIDHIDPANPTTTLRQLWYGWIASVTRNPNGKSGLVRADLVGIKSRINGVQVGIPMTTTCVLPFRGPLCRAEAGEWEREATITAVGPASYPNKITLGFDTVFDPATGLPNTRYRRGWITIDGLKLLIKRSLENFEFELFCVCPPWLVGEDCVLFPGCDKRLETCRIWNREENFVGLGIDLPARNPVFEHEP